VRLRRLAALAAFAAVVGGGLAYGLWPRAGRPTLAARVREIASGVRCPSCLDLSAAESDAPSAVAIRGFIRSELEAGKTASQIDAALVARYGPGILLAPPASGVGLLVWLVPAAVVLALGGGAAAGLVRRTSRLAGPSFVEEAVSPEAVSPEAVVDEPALGGLGGASRASGGPAEEEGRGVPEDRSKDRVRAAPRGRAPRLPGRLGNLPPRAAAGLRVGLSAGVLGLAVLGGLALGGAVAKGTPQAVDARLARELVKGRTLLDRGDDVGAAKVFSEVLAEDPRQPEGLAYEGFLLERAGRSSHDPALLDQALVLEREAVAADPSYPDAHLFLALLLAKDDHDPTDAVAQARLFLADHPTRALVERAAPVLRQVFAAAELPPPPLPAPSASAGRRAS
jgi:cytochrome c-type biogenesis protein CcmH/NrfF